MFRCPYCDALFQHGEFVCYGAKPKTTGGIHQTRDGAIRIFIGPARFFDLVYGVQHHSVVFAAELPANFQQHRTGYRSERKPTRKVFNPWRNSRKGPLWP
jgi:hypothetical protein